MDEEGTSFVIDNELDLTKTSSSNIKETVLKGLENVAKGHYMLIYINDYAQIAQIARAVATKKAAVDNVLKKGNNIWTVMVKNDVPVAQTG